MIRRVICEPLQLIRGLYSTIGDLKGSWTKQFAHSSLYMCVYMYVLLNSCLCWGLIIKKTSSYDIDDIIMTLI